MSVDRPLDKPPTRGPVKPSSETDFTLVGKPYLSNHPSGGIGSVEFRPGASSDDASEIKEAKERENGTDADWGAGYLNDIFRYFDSYSETYQIGKDGTFDLIIKDGLSGPGGPISLLGGMADTPEKFYQLANEIQKKHPDWHFEFDVDPSDQRFKYTVTKVKPENK